MKKLFLLLGIIFLASCSSSGDYMGSFATDLATLKQIHAASPGNLNWDFDATNPDEISPYIIWETINEEQRVTVLDVRNKQLTSLAGIEKLYQLKDLYCPMNQLETLDVSKNVNLKLLDCYDNKLTTLDVSKNTALVELYCHKNQFSRLVITHLEAHPNFCTENAYFSLSPQYKPNTEEVNDNINYEDCDK